MVVGKGMLAKRFSDYENNQQFNIFVSGVSDSSVHNSASFNRESNLLLLQTTIAPEKTLVYFSTCSIYDKSLQAHPYVHHKLKMEKLIQDNFSSYLIFRVSNPIGFTQNRHTVFNFFIDHILEQKPFRLWANAERNILDIDDMYLACKYILDSNKYSNQIVVVANPVNYSVQRIVTEIETFFSKKAVYELCDSGGGPEIDKAQMENLFRKLNISFGADYLEKILKKYFSNELPESFTQKKD